MKRILIAAFAGLAACAASAVHARGVDLQGDVLVALVLADAETLVAPQNSRRGNEPAPATYADGALRLGGGGSRHGDAQPGVDAPVSGSATTADEQDEPRPTTSGPHAAAWRALLPGSIQ